jgi:hypothetical protein
MNEDFLINHILRLDPDEAQLEIPSLREFLGYVAAPLGFEIGCAGDPISIFSSQPDVVEMSAADALWSWIARLRSSLKPWELVSMKGALELNDAPGLAYNQRSQVDTYFDLLVLRRSAYILRQLLPEGLAAQLTRDDQIILSLRVQSQRRNQQMIKAHIELADRQVERKLSDEHLAALTYHLQNCESEIAEFMAAVLPWFQSSGVHRIDLAIALLPNSG